jgi:SagB-type dehydrogenase family enzyme
MPTEHSFQVAGVDGCKAGWFVAIASVTMENETNTSCEFSLKNVFVANAFTEVFSKTSDCKLVCVDIPIGLSDGDKPRECDGAARELLRGRRASSVFPSPIRPCLSAVDYETASKISFEYTGKKLNKQTFALMKKIREVDDLMTPELQNRVREIHPEVLFWALNGQKPIELNKKTVIGQAQRHSLLQVIFTDIDSILVRAPISGYAMDDALDAIVAAWTAGQAVIGKAKTLPEKPPLDSKGLRMEMLYPACYNQWLNIENNSGVITMSELINLPKPNQDGSMSLEKTIAVRRSRRSFLPQSLTFEQISQLTWAAQGQDTSSRFRTAPSAGATYPLELFVVTGDGLFHYLPAEHSLEKLTGQDLRAALASSAWGQEFIEAAPLTLVFAAEFSRTTNHYGKRGIRYVYMEAGHAAQNVHLQAEALGLGSVAVGAFDDASVSKVLSLPAVRRPAEKNLEPVYMVTVGHCR